MGGGRVADCKSKIKVVADNKKNRLYIKVSGDLDAQSLDKLYTEIRFCVADLKNYFNVIEDISQCNIIYLNGLDVYKKIINYLVSNMVGEIIRVIETNNISYKQIVNFTEKIQCYIQMYVTNIDEAEKKLKQAIKRNCIRFKLYGPGVEYMINSMPGIGYLIDVSTSGCAIKSPTIPVSVGSETIVSITFDNHDTLMSKFNINARVVRSNNDMFAAHFSNFDDSNKEQLYKRLAYEVGRLTCYS